MPSCVYMHIGLHKTGTTSFQEFIARHHDLMAAHGFDIYTPLRDPRYNASEIGTAVIRPEAMRVHRQDQLYARLLKHIEHQLNASTLDKFLLSGENISLLRTDAEFSKLKYFFSSQNLRFIGILVLRDREEWFNSYKKEVLKTGRKGSYSCNSAYYLDPNGWLTDFNRLTTLCHRHFDEFYTISYDKNDSITPLLTQLGVICCDDAVTIRRNASKHWLLHWLHGFRPVRKTYRFLRNRIYVR